MALKTAKAQLFDRVLDTDGDAIGGGLSADDIRSLVD